MTSWWNCAHLALECCWKLAFTIAQNTPVNTLISEHFGHNCQTTIIPCISTLKVYMYIHVHVHRVHSYMNCLDVTRRHRSVMDIRTTMRQAVYLNIRVKFCIVLQDRHIAWLKKTSQKCLVSCWLGLCLDLCLFWNVSNKWSAFYGSNPHNSTFALIVSRYLRQNEFACFPFDCR